MRRAPVLALLLVCTALPTRAQGLKITQPPADCHLTTSAFDNPFSDTHGYWQPRVVWHAEFALGTYLVADLVHRVTHLPPWASATVAAVGIGVLPHVRSVLIQRRYPINPGDLAFDAVNRGTPFVWLAGHSDDTTRTWVGNHWKPAVTWLAADLALACFSSP